MHRAIVAALAVVWLAIPAAAGDIDPYERGTFATIRAAHTQRPLVVHFWSLTCIPCLVEMPRLAAMTKSRGDFDLVLVATDPIAQAERIAVRLDKFGLADAPSYAYVDSFEERLRFEVDRTWRGELPFTALVKAGGEMKTVAGELEPATLGAWLDEDGATR